MHAEVAVNYDNFDRIPPTNYRYNQTIMKLLNYVAILALFAIAGCDTKQTSTNASAPADTSAGTEKHRPQIHFSPKAHWMNDPNGMVFLNGKYHLFFQHNPDSTVWGPMHWGHAISTDLVHWAEQPIALYPDSLGAIFSGSAVVDENNTSGFGKNALVAIYTYHNQKLEDVKDPKHQYQAIAYSNDEGKTWTKYKGNPVLPNPGIYDFRDPKVQWLPAQKKWMMTLATKDRITFYSSPDLKAWTRESEFGATVGAHGGVWECPDLIGMDLNGQQKWVLLVSINPGGPNGGSATQYFIGSFDGKTFTPDNTQTRWLDYGPDNYAGVTWSNTGKRHILLGWMSNWNYANKVPTENWRSAMTIPRELSLNAGKNGPELVSQPVKELQSLYTKTEDLASQKIDGVLDLSGKVSGFDGGYVLKMSVPQLKSYNIKLFNNAKEYLLVGYDAGKNEYYINRTNAGESDFQKGFAGRFTAPRLATSPGADLELVIDKASVELFADGGLTNMTAIFFPKEDYSKLSITGAGLQIDSLKLVGLKSIWK